MGRLRLAVPRVVRHAFVACGLWPLGACTALVDFPAVPDERTGPVDASVWDAGGAHDAHTDASHDAPVDVLRQAHPDAARDAALADALQRPDAPGTDGGSCQRDDAGVCLVPPSCQGTSSYGLRDCGYQSDDDCCATLLVPGGMYSRTFTSGPTGPTGEMNTAFVSSFRLDKYPVTVGRFAAYVAYRASSGAYPAAGSGKHSHLNAGNGLSNIDEGMAEGGAMYESGWQASWDLPALLPTTTTGWAGLLDCAAPSNAWEVPVTEDHLPINCVGWTEAYAFCIWDGGFLPSEAEWELAAVGGPASSSIPGGARLPAS